MRELGGLVPLWDLDRRAVIRAAERFPLFQVEPAVARWAKETDEVWARRHWPWVALASDQWLFQHRYRSGVTLPEYRPGDVKAAFARIAKNAEAIAQDLADLQMATNNTVASAQHQPGHVGWLLTGVCLFQERDFSTADKAAEGFTADEIATAMFAQIALTERLVRLSVAAGHFGEFADIDLLRRTKPGVDPVLPTYVGRLATIWESLSGRRASVGKVHRADDDRPVFVIFCQECASMALACAGEGAAPPLPSPDQVAAALAASRKP